MDQIVSKDDAKSRLFCDTLFALNILQVQSHRKIISPGVSRYAERVEATLL